MASADPKPRPGYRWSVDKTTDQEIQQAIDSGDFRIDGVDGDELVVSTAAGFVYVFQYDEDWTWG